MRACVCTSYAADREPRAPRHARAIWDTNLFSRLTFIDLRPSGTERVQVDYLDGISGIEWISLENPTRSMRPLGWLRSKVRKTISRLLFRAFGSLSTSILGPSLLELKSAIERSESDLVLCHNIDTLFPAYLACKATGAKLIFDSMEFHSDMGDGQDELSCYAIKAIEELCLARCCLVLTSSSQVAQALAERYHLGELLALENVPKLQVLSAQDKEKPLCLYWRNSMIGLGQRGLEDAIRALSLLPDSITLYLQGRATETGLKKVELIAREVGVWSRIKILGPYKPEQAVAEASKYHVGLCLERSGVRNHELTISNKMYDYHMAGLAVVSSDMPSLASVLERSGGGITYKAGDVHDLAAAIRILNDDDSLRRKLSENARSFAENVGNWDVESKKLQSAILNLYKS